jgi:hypothetical protein
MSDAMLLEIIRRLPPEKAQEIYDFASFLDQTYPAAATPNKLEGFGSEDEMLDYINDIGRKVYAS